MEIIDVSIPISDLMLIYKGDPKVKIDQVKNIPSDGVAISKITMGLHSGTHIDTPSHFFEGEESVDNLNLESFVGEAMVYDLTCVKESIEEYDLKNYGINAGDILLFKTKNFELYEKNSFSNEFIYLSEGGAEYLVERRVKTVGIDYLSIERSGSKDHPVHKLLLSNRISIIEGLDLRAVKPGKYTIFCLPLKIVGVEASPARCILIR